MKKEAEKVFGICLTNLEKTTRRICTLELFCHLKIKIKTSTYYHPPTTTHSHPSRVSHNRARKNRRSRPWCFQNEVHHWRRSHHRHRKDDITLSCTLAWRKKLNGSVPLCCTSMGLNPLGFFCWCFFWFWKQWRDPVFSSWKRFTTMVRMKSAGRFLFWVGWDMLQIPFHEPNSSKFPSKICFKKKNNSPPPKLGFPYVWSWPQGRKSYSR